ncbi:MAG: purine-nucleoside phosphorylase [Verrucomicrobiae bacterium]|nr:purine-nucleoside phosphorylase [Verrucomicrobiae bacterium]
MSAAIDFIKEKSQGRAVSVGLILGSGLNDFAHHCIQDTLTIPYADIPGFPQSTAPGHKGNLIMGKVGDVPVVCMQGRFHKYEGYSMQEVTATVRLMADLGIKTLIVTNASGGINPDFNAGDLMLITDHVNRMGDNPLIGPVEEGCVRFPDMTHAYDRELIGIAEAAAARNGIALHKGVYVANPGPSFETPAEIRAYGRLGIDAVGMSTVPEVIYARSRGIRVLGISLISNKAAGLSGQLLTEEEVFEAATAAKDKIIGLLMEVLSNI